MKLRQTVPLFLLLFFNILSALTFFTTAHAAEIPAKKLKPATPSIDSGQTAKEVEWRDARWSDMNVGQFLSSTVRLPHVYAAKGLSIQVGTNDDASVCYDTLLCNLRATWTGKFLLFIPDRYGLLNSPKPAGPLLSLAPGNEGWVGKPTHYRGLFLNGNRVVLSYTVGNVPVLESPWLETHEKIQAFTRNFEIGTVNEPYTLNLAEVRKSRAHVEKTDALSIATLQSSNIVTAIIVNDESCELSAANDRIQLTFLAKNTARQCRVFIWSGETNELDHFIALAKNCRPPELLEPLTKPGSNRWGEPLVTKGEVAAASNEPYVVDTITVPYENRFKALMFLSGLDFFDNGDAAVCSIHGDVWIVSGIDDQLQKIKWTRFATGLFQPLGLKIVNNEVYVLGRDQITILHDRNNDGEADFYENFCNEIRTSEGGHDYVTSLETDAGKNFYFVDPSGLHRISPDGKKFETIATGFRNPNGMGISPEGIITVAPQEGTWTPSSAICEIKPNGYYGFGGPQISPERPLGYDAPLCWIPRLIDNSSGSQVWVTSDNWGPLKNQMLNFSFGRCSMMLVLREAIDGTAQGGVVPLKPHFLSGAMRGTFRKKDGQLYVVGSLGWATSATRDGCFQRVRYTGRKAYLPTALHIFENGIELTFSEALERETAEDVGSYNVEVWNYLYSQEYGSKEYSVSQPKEVGHDPLDVTRATLSADGHSVFLQISGITPVMQMEIQYNLNSADGKTVRGEIYNTIHKLIKSPVPPTENSTSGSK